MIAIAAVATEFTQNDMASAFALGLFSAWGAFMLLGGLPRL